MKHKLLSILCLLSLWATAAWAQTDVTSLFVKNADFEGDYSVYATPTSDRAIYQPEGWSIEWGNTNSNDMSALNSDCLQWSNFSSKPQPTSGGNNVYWIRFRWGTTAYITMSQDVTLPAGTYTLSADMIHYDGSNGTLTLFAGDNTATCSYSSEAWSNVELTFTLTDESTVSIGAKAAQGKQEQTIMGFDNFKLVGSNIAPPIVVVKADDVAANEFEGFELTGYTVTDMDGNAVDVTLTTPPTLTATASYGSTANSGSDDGEYIITPSDAAVDDYFIVYQTGTLTINEATHSEDANLDFANGNPIADGITTTAADRATNNVTRYGLQPVDGWTYTNSNESNINAAGGLFEYGGSTLLMGNKKGAPASGPNDDSGANCLGLVSVWGNTAYYSCETTLEAGAYTMTVPVYNAGGTNAITSLIGVTVDGTSTYGSTTNFTESAWTTETILFNVAEAGKVTVTLGYKSTGGGSGANPHLFFDGVTITQSADEYNVGDATISPASGFITSNPTFTITYTPSTNTSATFSILNESGVTLSDGTNTYTGTLSLADGVLTATFSDVAETTAGYILTIAEGTVGYNEANANAEATSGTYLTGATSLAAGEYYLYNVGTGAYVSHGMTWKTHAVAYPNNGFLNTVALSNGAYTIYNSYYSRYFTDNAYVDSQTSTPWFLVPVDESEGTFKLATSAGQYAYTTTDDGTYQFVTDFPVLVGNDTGDDYSVWKFVSAEEYASAMDNASLTNPVSVSLYITNANFDYEDGAITGWEYTGEYKTGGNDTNDFSRNYCIEKWHGVISLYQTLSDLPSGKYKLTVQGFTNESETEFAQLFINDDEANFKLRSDEEAGEPGGMSAAADAFRLGYYVNEVYSHVKSGSDIKIGVKNENTNIWFIFDNFNLYYLGKTIISESVDYTESTTATEGTWYAYTPTETGPYTVTEGLAYTTNGDQNTSGYTTEGTTTSTMTLEAGTTYYFYVPADGTISIETQIVTITATAAEITYGDEFEFAYTTSPETELTGTVSYTITDSEGNDVTSTSPLPAGTYTVTPTYEGDEAVSFVSATLTVNKATVTLTVTDAEKAEFAEMPEFTYTLEPEVELSSEVTLYARGAYEKNGTTYYSTVNAGSDDGTYEIVAEVEDDNYEITVVNGTLTITEAEHKTDLNLDFATGNPIADGIATYDYDRGTNNVTRYGLQPVDGWTLNSTDNARAGGLFAYGGDTWLGSTGYTAPATGPNGETSGNCLGLVSVWSATSQYTCTHSLVAGRYVMTVPVYNAAGTGSLSANLIGVIVGDNTYYAETTTYPVGEWTTEEIVFTLSEDADVTISLGFTVSDIGSTSAPHLFIDGVTITDKPAETYTLNVSSYGLATMYLDYAVAIPDDVLGVYYATEANADDKDLVVKEITTGYIPANTGVIVMANLGTYTFTETFNEVDAIEGNILEGTVEEDVAVSDAIANSTVCADGNSLFTLGLGTKGYIGFYEFTDETLVANRAYIVYKKDEASSESSEANMFGLRIGGSDDPTSIESVEKANGENDAVYDLMGRRVNNPGKGIFIINGKKVLR